jgi:hypothetical protein
MATAGSCGNVIAKKAPQAICAQDRFDVMQKMNRATYKARAAEAKQFQADGLHPI